MSVRLPGCLAIPFSDSVSIARWRNACVAASNAFDRGQHGKLIPRPNAIGRKQVASPYDIMFTFAISMYRVAQNKIPYQTICNISGGGVLYSERPCTFQIVRGSCQRHLASWRRRRPTTSRCRAERRRTRGAPRTCSSRGTATNFRCRRRAG